jgi:hypothetical protein
MDMGRTWVLDTETKGTGANVVPLEKVQRQPEARPPRASRPAGKTPARRGSGASRGPKRTPRERVPAAVTDLPPGHVRKKATGEIGRVRSIDPKAGTAVVHWLKRGSTSTVPLSAIARR